MLVHIFLGISIFSLMELSLHQQALLQCFLSINIVLNGMTLERSSILMIV
uniref:Uncharacterized protein n=1 Tax=Arundo donax TaxID=35708 RepID=A0A0A9CPV2_ARUDO